MMAFLDRVRSTIVQHRMFERGDRVVVAVSGGADSMALLHALIGLRAEFGLSLHVAHFDHNLRPDSAEDAAFVQRAAVSLQLPATVGSADVRALAAAKKRSMEDAARQARYAFLQEVAAGSNAVAVATGHTLGDQAETVLMRLLDAAPWETLAGIPPVRPLGTVRVVRPLLDVSRAEIHGFLRGRGLMWRDDPTNLDPAMRRNWVRHVVLPALSHQAPDLPGALARIASPVRAATGLLWAVADREYAAVRVRSGDAVQLLLSAVERYPRAVRRRLIRRAWLEATGTEAGMSRVIDDAALKLASRRKPGEFAVGPWVIRRSYDALIITAAPPPPPGEEYPLRIPGEVLALGFGVRISAELIPPGEAAGALRAGEAFLDADQAGTELRVRPWRPGDHFRPLGMRGTKKVQDLLVDQKVPRWVRGRIPLVVDAQGRIVWVVGQRIAEDVKVTAATKRVARLRVHPLAAPVAATPFA